jgi:hypothetical protein
MRLPGAVCLCQQVPAPLEVSPVSEAWRGCGPCMRAAVVVTYMLAVSNDGC